MLIRSFENISESVMGDGSFLIPGNRSQSQSVRQQLHGKASNMFLMVSVKGVIGFWFLQYFLTSGILPVLL